MEAGASAECVRVRTCEVAHVINFAHVISACGELIRSSNLLQDSEGATALERKFAELTKGRAEPYESPLPAGRSDLSDPTLPAPPHPSPRVPAPPHPIPSVPIPSVPTSSAGRFLSSLLRLELLVFLSISCATCLSEHLTTFASRRSPQECSDHIVIT